MGASEAWYKSFLDWITGASTDAARVNTTPRTYIRDQRIAATGNATLPPTADTVRITNDGGTVRYQINGTAAAAVGTPVAANTSLWIGPISNLVTLHVYINAGAAVLEYWRET